MYVLEIEDDFAAAHQLRGYHGKCENLHGHNWRVRVGVRGTQLLNSGMLMDFGDLKKIVKEVLGALDHRFLNETGPFVADNPTTERIARHIYEEVARRLPENVRMDGVTAWESEKSRATYRED